MAAEQKNITKKIPLTWRMIAWWEGYDIADIEEKMRLRKQEKNAGKNKAPASTEEKSKKLWDEAQIRVTQMVWGEGFCGPGGRQNVIDMSKLLALSPKMSAMVIGAGLGGPSRVLAQEFGVWINGYETNELLAKEGMELSTAKGLEKKAPIIHIDLNNNPSFDRTFDRAFSKEFLFIIENKGPLIKSIYEQLKDDSLFLISDYIIRDEACLSDPDVIKWINHVPTKLFLLTSGAMMKCIEDCGFNIRIHEDISDHYLEMISEAWGNTALTIKKAGEDDQSDQNYMLAIQKEAELWTSLTKVLRAGKVQLFRYLAHKPHEAKL